MIHRQLRSILVRCTLLGLAMLLPAATEYGQTVDEYEVKAAFLYNFSKFVDWPAARATGPFSICIFGDDPFGIKIEIATRGKTVNGREIRIRRLKDPAEARDCHILFAASADKKKTQQLFDAISLLPVLIVGENEEFLRAGGMVNLSTTGDDRVGVVINNAAAEANGLKISVKLLSLATIYKKGK
jgi:hypothetical protein